MYAMKVSQVFFIFLASGMIFSAAFAEVDVEAGTKIDTEVKIGTEQENDETKSSDNAEIETSTRTETSVKAESTSSTKSDIKTSYSQIMADTKNSLIIQTERHLYKSGDEVQVEGSIWSTLNLDGIDLIRIQVMDNNGTIIYDGKAQISNDGKFNTKFTLPDDAKKGSYTIKTNINTDVNGFETISLDTDANVQTSTRFVVASSSAYVVKAEGQEFAVNIASNSNVDRFEFNQEAKRITFTVEGETGTKGVTEVTIPKAMLSGEMMVLIDGKVASPDDVIVASNTETETTFEINYHHSVHSIDVTGTNVVPEFPTASFIFVAGIAVAVLVATKKYNHDIKVLHRNSTRHF